jgi:putative ABC transport system permease protein
VLNVTDLTCDASVTLGGCSYGALILSGIDPLIAIIIAACLGMVAGLVTSSLVAHVGIEPVLASIVTLTALQTFITKLSSIGHTLVHRGLTETTLITPAIGNSIITLIIASVVCILFYRILNSEYGLAMRVYGDGKIISESLGIDTGQILCMGLGIGNALSAIAGALVVQISGNFGPGIGNGSLVFGLAAVIIGEKVLAPRACRQERDLI